jgi:hypothetical protein
MLDYTPQTNERPASGRSEVARVLLAVLTHGLSTVFAIHGGRRLWSRR